VAPNRGIRADMSRSLLLGGVLLLVSLLLGLQQAELVESLMSPGLTERLVGGEFGLVFGNFARRFDRLNLHHRNDRLRGDLGGDVHLLLGGISLVRFAQLLREENEFGFVLLETLNVLLKRLNALVAPTVVDRDADRSGEILVETGGLDLLQGKAATETLLLVVFDGRASYDRPEGGGRSGRDTSCLGLSGLSASDLPRRLIKPRLDAILPILLEMGVLNDVIVFRSHGLFF